VAIKRLFFFSEHLVIAGGLWQPTEATDVDAAAAVLLMLLLLLLLAACCRCCGR